MLLKDNYEKIVTRINELDAAQKPQWGKLTTKRLIAHLIDSFGFALAHKKLEMKGSLMPKFIMKWLTIYSPMPWPKGIKVPDEFFEYEADDLAQDKAKLIKLIDEFIALPDTHNTEHPLFGKMSKKDWDHLSLRHLKHHFKQFNAEI